MLALIARRLAGDRAAVAAAALAATSPLLIWYSQEARAYGLLVALCAVSVWCLLRRDWRGWALTAALALATHYFAVFVVVPEVGWLLWRYVRPAGQPRERRAVAWAIAAVGVVALALAPLAIEQAGGDRARFITAQGLGRRLVQIPKQFLIGYATPHATLLTVLAAALAVALACGLRRSDRGLLALVLIAVGVPVALAAFGADYLITRNLVAALVPLIVLAAVAATRTRAGPVLIGGLCVIGVVAFAGVESNTLYQRDDWSGVAAALGPATHGPRVVVVNPSDGVPGARDLRAVARTLPGPAIRHVGDRRHQRAAQPAAAEPNRDRRLLAVFTAGADTRVRARALLRAGSITVTYHQFADLTLTGRPPSILVGGT